MNMRQYMEGVLRAIHKNRWWILAIMTAAVILGVIVGLTTTPLYQAASQIEISRKQDNVTSVEGVTSDIDLRDPMFYQTQYELLQSQSLAERVVLELDLLNDPRFISDEARQQAAESGTPAPSPERRLRMAGNRLRGGIGITPVGLSSLVSISYRSSDPTLAADVANSWASEFIKANLDRRFSATNDARDYLEEQLSGLRQRLEESERELVGYAAGEDIVTFTGQDDQAGAGSGGTTLAGSNLQALNAELARAVAARIAAESELNGGANMPGTAATSGALASLVARRAELQADYARITELFLPDYPAARQVQSQIDAIDQSIARERARIGDENSTNLRRARLRESELQAQVNSLKSDYVRQQRAGIQYTILQREVDTNRTLYEGLLQRYKEIGVAGVGTNNVAIVDHAEVPSSPVVPSWPMLIITSLFLGALAAGAVVYVREQLDYTVQDPTDVTNLLGMPLLGSVPMGEDHVISAAIDPKTDVYEAYLTLRTNLNLLTDHGAPRALMISSTRPGEGKSYSSVMVAELLARLGRSVILVDADMRASHMNRTLGLGDRMGLSELLTGNAAFEDLNVDPGHPDLHFKFLSAGARPPNAADLLSGDNFGELMTGLKAQFDHVIVDSPPLLSLADGPLIGRHVDGAVLAVQAYTTKVRPIQNTISRLQTAHVQVFGVLVTKLSEKRGSYGSSYGYGYGYGYGSGDKAEPAEA